MEKLAIITGATSGLGYEMARILAKEPVDLLLLARNRERLEEVKKELSSLTNYRVDILALDLMSHTYEEELVAKVGDQPVQYVINNAGFGDFGPFLELTLQRQQAMIDLNVRTVTTIAYHFIQWTKGATYPVYLLNVGSIAAYNAGPLMAVYFATKAFVRSFTRALAYEQRTRNNVHITCLCPGPTATNFMEAAFLEDSGLFKILKPMNASVVASQGIEGLKAGKSVVIPGLRNKLMVFLTRYCPDKLVEAITYRIMRSQ